MRLIPILTALTLALGASGCTKKRDRLSSDLLGHLCAKPPGHLGDELDQRRSRLLSQPLTANIACRVIDRLGQSGTYREIAGLDAIIRLLGSAKGKDFDTTHLDRRFLEVMPFAPGDIGYRT